MWRLLLVLVLASPAHAADVPQKTIDMLLTLNAKFAEEKALHADAPLAVKIESATDSTLTKLCKHPAIGSLDIGDATKITEKGLTDLRELPRVQKLILFKSNLNDKGLEQIGHIRALETLYLGESKITDAGMPALGKLADLKILDLMDTKVGDRGVAALANLLKLEDLNLSGTKVGDAGVAALKGCKGLLTLKLTRTTVSEKVEKELQAALPKLVVRH